MNDHPSCPRCDGELEVKPVSLDYRMKFRIGGARVYYCQQCRRDIIMTRAEGSRAYHKAWIKQQNKL